MAPRLPNTWVGLLRAFAAFSLMAIFPCLTLSGTTGKIAGKLTDAQSKEPLVGANVLIMGTALGASSDVEGNYFIINIPPGAVTLKISAVGYAPAIFKDVKVAVDQTTRIDVELQ